MLLYVLCEVFLLVSTGEMLCQVVNHALFIIPQNHLLITKPSITYLNMNIWFGYVKILSIISTCELSEPLAKELCTFNWLRSSSLDRDMSGKSYLESVYHISKL